MGLVAEFKAFIMRGNVIDLAVGVIIAGAFGGVVSSLVSDILTPPISALTSGVDFKDIAFEIPGKLPNPDYKAAQEAVAKAKDGPEKVAAEKTLKETPEKQGVKIGVGKFLQKLFDFVIIGFCLFLIIKAMNAATKKKEADAPPPPPTKSETLLMEIRDALKK
jgi:large conductance mechanosensitive channel